MGFSGTSFLQQDLTSVKQINARLKESRLREAGVKGMKWGQHIAQAKKEGLNDMHLNALRDFRPEGHIMTGRKSFLKALTDNGYLQTTGSQPIFSERHGAGKAYGGGKKQYPVMKLTSKGKALQRDIKGSAKRNLGRTDAEDLAGSMDERTRGPKSGGRTDAEDLAGGMGEEF